MERQLLAVHLAELDDGGKLQESRLSAHEIQPSTENRVTRQWRKP